MRKIPSIFKAVVVLLFIVAYQTYAEIKKSILIAGNFSIDGVQYNIAEYDPTTDSWRENYNSQVYLYSEENSGVVWDVALNETNSYTDIFAAGLFDTDAKISQVQLCSVAVYESGDIDKIGEGLCSRGGDYGPISVKSIVIGNQGDIFVGGSFISRVWDRNRHKFVLVSHVARFDASSWSWLPLEGSGELTHDNIETASVNTLLWDVVLQELYIGGIFKMVNNITSTHNLAVWSAEGGIQPFPGGNTLSMDTPNEFEITHVFQEVTTKTLIVIGSFNRLNANNCFGIALWNRILNEWRCLMDVQDMLSSYDAAAFNGHKLFLAGPLVPDVFDTKPISTQYGVIYMSIDSIIDEYSYKINALFPNNSTNSSNSTSGSFTNSTHIRGALKNRRIISHIEQHRKLYHSRHQRQSRYRRLHLRQQLVSENYENRKHFNLADIPSLPNAPWSTLWNWLPQLPFLSRKILYVKAGSDPWQDSLFISLDNDTLPSLLAWNFPPRKNGNGNISFIGSHNHPPYGPIHSIEFVSIPQAHPPTPSPSVNNNPTPAASNDYTYIVVISCLGVGLILGAGIICTCMGNGNIMVWKEAPLDNSSLDIDDSDEVAAPGPISLKTLTDSGQAGSNSLDFKECFERAMKTRHLPTYETLVIINPKEILLSRIIGEGSFGRVWSGQWRNNSVAVKEFVFAQAAIAGGSLQRNSIIEEIVGEAGVMACLRHPKILQLYGCSLTMQAIWIVSELCLLGSLKMLLMNPKVELPLLKRLSMLLDIADGMQYLHNRNPPIIHRDLKSHNIFIQETFPGHYIAKIGDWGSARAVALSGAKSMTQGVGTACWLSPEVINNAHFSKSSDVYAFGIILWEVYTRQEIYEGLSAAQIIAKVAHEGLRPQVPRDCPWSTIMTKCWRQDPIDRPSFETILSSLGRNFLKLTSKNNQQQGDHGGTSTSPVPPFPPSAPNSSIEMIPAAPSERSKSGGKREETSSSTYHDSSGSWQQFGQSKSLSGGSLADPTRGFVISASSPAINSLRSAYRTLSRERMERIDEEEQEEEDKHRNLNVTEETSLLRPSVSTIASRSGSEKSLKSSPQPSQQQPQSGHLNPTTPVRKSSRTGKFYDSFHPSLENIVTETKTPFSSSRLSQLEESPAHLAPEIAQLEAQGLWTSLESQQGYLAATEGSRGGSGIGLALDGDTYADEDDPADPIDFLFDSHRSTRSQRKKK